MCAFSTGVSDAVIDEHALEAGHVAGPCCVENGSEQAVSPPPSNRPVPLLGEVHPSSPPELPRVGFADLERASDLSERVAEPLPEDEDRAFGWRQPLEQEPDGVLEVR